MMKNKKKITNKFNDPDTYLILTSAKGIQEFDRVIEEEFLKQGHVFVKKIK